MLLSQQKKKKKRPQDLTGVLCQFAKKLLLSNLTRQKSEALSLFEKHKIVTERLTTLGHPEKQQVSR